MNVDGFSATMGTIDNLKENPNSTNLDKLMNEEEFLSFSEQILKTSSTISPMAISYIKEVGNLLALISSVQELTIERYLQAEWLMLPDTFALVIQIMSDT